MTQRPMTIHEEAIYELTLELWRLSIWMRFMPEETLVQCKIGLGQYISWLTRQVQKRVLPSESYSTNDLSIGGLRWFMDEEDAKNPPWPWNKEWVWEADPKKAPQEDWTTKKS